MSIIFSNECCNCASPGFPCIGERCELLHYPHYICDECDDDVDVLYWYEGRQLCRHCVLKELEVVTTDE